MMLRILKRKPVYELLTNDSLSSQLLVLEDLVDPVPELGYPGVHSGLVPLGTPDAPADDAPQHEPPVLPLHTHRAATVPLAVNWVTNVTEQMVRVPCHGACV